MRINSVNINQQHNFKGIKSATPGVSQEIFGENEKVLDLISEEKNLDIWAFKRTKGGMMSATTRYIVLIQDKNGGNVVKEIQGFSEDTPEINRRIEESLIWFNAKNNLLVADRLKSSDVYQQFLEKSSAMESSLVKTAISNEAHSWQQRLDLV